MPDIDIERRQSSGFPMWAWIIGALVLILVIWGIVEAVTPEREAVAPVAPAERVAGERQATEGMQDLPIANMVANPTNYFGQDVAGVAMVAEVVSDRGFWIENNGERAFVVLSEGMPETGVTIDAGNRVLIHGNFLQSVNDLPNAQTLEPQARQIIEGQQGFIRAQAIDVLREGQTQQQPS